MAIDHSSVSALIKRISGLEDNNLAHQRNVNSNKTYIKQYQDASDSSQKQIDENNQLLTKLKIELIDALHGEVTGHEIAEYKVKKLAKKAKRTRKA